MTDNSRPSQGVAIPLRTTGLYRIYKSCEGRVTPHSEPAMNAEEVLHTYRREMEYLTDGYALDRITRIGNVTTVYYKHHNPVSIWLEASDKEQA